MDAIADITDALAEISDQDLNGLQAILGDRTIAVRGLQDWLDVAIGWEMGRRIGARHELYSPRLTINRQSDLEASLVALAMMHSQLRDVVGVAEFFDAIANALCTPDIPALSPTLH